ncbi:PHB depolymerase family esterase [Actinomycetospora flava]|uniref:PHB depolymerase family esterase n=1 Tax=Actinomycetospora flava TaxID=3129232 RepID=A0ABU8MAJ1_9PSEU
MSEYREAGASAVRNRPHHPEQFYRSGPTPFFAAQADQRVSFALYVPQVHDAARSPMPLVVVVHGTARTAELYRNAWSGFAERHGCVVLTPLFPAGIGDPEDLHNFKFLAYGDIRFDRLLLDIVDEVVARFPVDGRRFLLHGFSGGGQFTHRFLYLHPERLAAVSIAAPGRVTMIDPDQPWWIGTADVADRFGHGIDLDAVRRVAVQMVVGEADIETWEINNPGGTNWMPGADAAGTTRVDRLHALHRNFAVHGIEARLDVVPGVGHHGTKLQPAVEGFFAEVLATLPRASA